MSKNYKLERKIQLDELDALQSIFHDEIINIKNNKHGDIQACFILNITLQENFSVKFKDSLLAEQYSHLKLNHLPPIKLRLKLPKNYPKKFPPKFTIYCQWLTKSAIAKLCKKLDELWLENKNMEIIYIWIDFLKNDSLIFLGYESELDLTELLSCHLKYIECRQESNHELAELKTRELKSEFNSDNYNKVAILHNENESEDVENDLEKQKKGIDSVLNDSNQNHYRCKDNQNGFKTYYYNTNFKGSRFKWKYPDYCDKRARLNLSYKTSPLTLLKNYNEKREKLEFEKKFFTCNICFCFKIGHECTKFENCNHVFCKSCVNGYFTVKIKEGSIHTMKCPESKCMSDATPLQVKTIVSPELFAKYDTLLLNSVLDSFDHVTYCPRPFCQYPAMRDKDEKLVICPNCQYVFCVFCRMVYHGVEPCKIKSEEKKKLLEEYVNSSQEVKEKLELRYGKTLIQGLLHDNMAESWIENNCKSCPHCNVSIEKSHGCNKMVCWKCDTYFCWLCSAKLDRTNPYDHFNNAKSSCANKLFFLTALGDEEFDDSDYDSDDEELYDWDWI